MSKLTKDQRRRQKLSSKRKERTGYQRYVAGVEAEKLRRANQQILDGVDAAVTRACAEFKMAPLAARIMIAEVIKDHLFMPVVANQPQTTAAQAVPSQPSNIIKTQKPAGFDRDAWRAGMAATVSKLDMDNNLSAPVLETTKGDE